MRNRKELDLAVISRDCLSPVWQIDNFVVAEENRGPLHETLVGSQGEKPDFYFGMITCPHLHHMPPGADIGRDYDRRFGFVRKHGSGTLLDLLASVSLRLTMKYSVSFLL